MAETASATPAQKERPELSIDLVRLEKILWGVVALALVGDVATTYHGLEMGLRESNPIARGVIDTHGMTGQMGLKTAAVAVALGCRQLLAVEYRPIVPLGLSAPWLIAVLLNVYLIVVIAP